MTCRNAHLMDPATGKLICSVKHVGTKPTTRLMTCFNCSRYARSRGLDRRKLFVVETITATDLA